MLRKVALFFYVYCGLGLSLLLLSTMFGDDVRSQDYEPIYPVPVKQNLDQRKVDLGDKLFHDVRLSKNNRVSCASCHGLDMGGVDRLPLSVGVSGQPTGTNSPTVFNIADHLAFFWDGRAETLEDQIDGPIHHPDEMATDWKDIRVKLSKDSYYEKVFYEIYRSPPKEAFIKDAIVEFEKSLITPNAPFDQYLQGDNQAISAEAIRGYKNFKSFGCVSCHQGRAIGGNMFQSFGVVGNYFEDRGMPITEADLGRYNVTGEAWDKHVFKVPSLRNVELTAPYFHDGSAETLEEAIDVMAKYQLGKTLTDEERQSLIAFLKSLTGEYKGVPLNEK